MSDLSKFKFVSVVWFIFFGLLIALPLEKWTSWTYWCSMVGLKFIILFYMFYLAYKLKPEHLPPDEF